MRAFDLWGVMRRRRQLYAALKVVLQQVSRWVRIWW